MSKPIILMSGLIGVGKSTLAKKLREILSGYEILSSTQQRRDLGVNDYQRWHAPFVEWYMLEEASQITKKGGGVIFDVMHHTYDGRRVKYHWARQEGIPIVLIEVVCGREMAIQRMKKRPVNPVGFSDTRDQAQYDKIEAVWQPIELDHLMHHDLTHFRYNSEIGQLAIIKANSAISGYLADLEAKL